MSSIAVRWNLLSQWVRGPYQVRGEKVLRVLGKKAARHSLAELRAGVTLAPGIELESLSDGAWLIALPASASLSRLSATGSQVIWNGQAGAELRSPASLSLQVPADGAYSIQWKDAGRLQRASFGLSADPLERTAATGWNLKTLERAVLCVALAIAVHVALLAIPGLVDRLRNLFPDLAPLAPLTEWSQPPIPIETQAVSGNPGDEFSGSYSLLSDSERAGQTAEKAAASVKKNLGGVLSRLAGLQVAGKPAAQNSGDSGLSGALRGLRERLGATAGGKASDEFRFVGQKQVGKDTATLFGDPSAALTHRDFEEVLAEINKQYSAAQACYESAMLQDEALSVSVDFESIVAASGQLGAPAFKVDGQKTNDSERTLKTCLGRVLSKVHVKPRLSGAKIRYQYIFKQ